MVDWALKQQLSIYLSLLFPLLLSSSVSIPSINEEEDFIINYYHHYDRVQQFALYLHPQRRRRSTLSRPLVNPPPNFHLDPSLITGTLYPGTGLVAWQRPLPPHPPPPTPRATRQCGFWCQFPSDGDGDCNARKVTHYTVTEGDYSGWLVQVE